MTKYVREHTLCLECVRKMHNDSRPLLGELSIKFRIPSILLDGTLAEVVEGLTYGLLVAAVGELTIKDGFVSMHTDAFLTMCKDSKASNSRFRKVLDHTVNNAFLERLAGLLGECHDIGNHRAKADISTWLEEIVDRCRRNTPTVRDFEQTWVSSNQQRTTTCSLRVLSARFQSILRIVRKDDYSDTIVFIA